MLRERDHYPRFVTFGIIISYSRDQDPDFKTWIRLTTCAYHLSWSRQSADDSCSMPSHFWLFIQLNLDRYLWRKFISISARFNRAEVQRKKQWFWKLEVNLVLQCIGGSSISQRGRQPKRLGHEPFNYFDQISPNKCMKMNQESIPIGCIPPALVATTRCQHWGCVPCGVCAWIPTPLEGTLNQACPPPRGQNDLQTPVKTLPSRNFVGGR